MNSTISEDLAREHLTLEAVKCLKNISSNSHDVSILHKELLEINLSITAYIEESKKRLAGLRLNLAHDAKDSYRVVEILSDKLFMITGGLRCSNDDLLDVRHLSPPVIMNAVKCSKRRKMSTPSPQSQFTSVCHASHKLQENNNNINKFSEHQQARTFVAWYKRMIDDERHNLGLYFSDDAMLEWFGRTIKTRKKVTAFLKYDMQCSRHDFTTIESIDKIQSRTEKLQRPSNTVLANPIHSPEMISSKDRCRKRRLLRSNCSSPEWAEGCQPPEENTVDKKLKTDYNDLDNESKKENTHKTLKRSLSHDEISNKGDGLLHKVKRKCVPVTPPNCEVGQGDCLPSTSGTDSDRSHDTLNAQLSKLAVECNGYIVFTRTRNSRSVDAMTWERKCKVQISYSVDPLNAGEYIIWVLRYTDESKCRRNLLAAFEEVAKEELKNV